MGGCSSNSDDAEIPKPASSLLQNKTISNIEQRTFASPAELATPLEVHTSNGTSTLIQEK